MTLKLVSTFRRSLSSPNHPSSKSPKNTLHVRSATLSCQSHPLISHLQDQIHDLKSWGSSKPDTRTSDWFCEGLTRLKTLHDSLDDLLHLPQTRESLRRHSDWVENHLEDFLRFVDVYGIFQTLILTLKQEHLAAQLAIRRRYDLKTDLYLKALKKMGKEIGKLVAAVKTIGRCSVPEFNSVSDGDAEVADVINGVNEVSVLVSVALFSEISSSFLLRKSSLWMGLKAKKVRIEGGILEFQEIGRGDLKKKGDEEVKMVLRRMNEMEDCIGGIECGSEKVFRSMINTRVSLLNLLTQ